MSARRARRIRAGTGAARGVQRVATPATYWLLAGARMPGSLFDNDRVTLRAYMRTLERGAS